MKLIATLAFILGMFSSRPSVADEATASPKTKGLLPEIKMNSGSEEENQKKAFETEALVTKTENEAIESLKKIINKHKGQADEAHLWYRLAELYMRRAKSGRFFDLYRDSDKAAKFLTPVMREQSAKKYLTEAVKIYQKIESSWPKFEDFDSVLFSEGFANQQLGLPGIAKKQYLHLIKDFPNSRLIPDAELAVGEMDYDQHLFAESIEHFKVIEKYPESKVYPYALYKSAWSYYNMKDNERAIHQMLLVVDQTTKVKSNHNLRSEALTDLTLFFADTRKADEAYEFFVKICSPEELGEMFTNLTKLYQSHSRDKEVLVFVNDFLNREKSAANEVQLRLLLVNSHETLKNRPAVISELKTIAEKCKSNSQYRALFQKQSADFCDMGFNHTLVEITKKWWELWQKNKTNKEIANLTMQAFELRLSQEDPLKPDSKTRFAYAELLFQLEDFKTASEQYEIVSDKTQDTSLIHDSSYASLVSYEKFKSHTSDRLLALSQKYLQKNPSGMHANQVKFKIGFTYYESKNYADADLYLRPLATSKNNNEFKQKSEDLVLDILNAQKKYLEIKDFALAIAKNTTDEKRKKEMFKISEEAEFASIQEIAQTNEKKKAANQLYTFYKDHPSSPQAQNAIWQSLSLNFASGFKLEAADQTSEFVKKYPEDKRNLDALKESAKSYLQSGFLEKSAQVLELIISKTSGETQRQNIEAAYELYLALGNEKKARSLIPPGTEPYSSLFQVEKCEQLIEQERWSDAFQSTKNLISGKTPAEAKARANIVRGRVLEHELASQSTKTSLERMTQVIGIKTEKLERTQEAYTLAAKLAETEASKKSALQGLSRAYQNYIDSIEHLTIKNELSVDEKKALDNELQKLLSPVKIRAEELRAKISANISNQQRQTASSDTLSSNDTFKPITPSLSSIKVDYYLPQTTKDVSRFVLAKSDKCDSHELTSAKDDLGIMNYINKCISLKNFTQAQTGTEKLTREYPSNPYGLMYFSIVSDLQSQPKKSKILFELLSKTAATAPAINYNLGKWYLDQNDAKLAKSFFEKITEKQFSTQELNLISALDSYKVGDCIGVTDHLSNIKVSTLTETQLLPIYAECISLKGDTDKAIGILKSELSTKKFENYIWLEIARLQEGYKFEKQEAIKAYKSAAEKNSDKALGIWIEKKLSSLSNGGSAGGSQ